MAEDVSPSGEQRTPEGDAAPMRRSPSHAGILPPPRLHAPESITEARTNPRVPAPWTLQDAVEARQLFVALQPVVDLHRREIFGYEALVRSRTPHYPDPPSILRAATESRYLGQMGRVIRDMAVKACPNARLFLNVDPNEFNEGWLVRPDDPIFGHDHAVYLEITESVPLSHFRQCNSVLTEIRGKGVFLAVDDLGAGYSNLKYIADLAPEVVKLDRELIAEVHLQQRVQKLVTHMVRLCDELGAKVVVEGIETREELKAIIDTGARFAQGFLLARPSFPAPTVDLDLLK
jgi:EAL domain-containing protein (putative c-di-GMP-specific phosphodiesterase class I)